jgi:hypothetical protein
VVASIWFQSSTAITALPDQENVAGNITFSTSAISL